MKYLSTGKELVLHLSRLTRYCRTKMEQMKVSACDESLLSHKIPVHLFDTVNSEETCRVILSDGSATLVLAMAVRTCIIRKTIVSVGAIL